MCDERHNGAPGAVIVPPARTPVAARPLLKLVHWYQSAREGRPSPCRFVPSCSTYMAEALEQHGAVRGTGLGLRRLIRCHPWGGEGYDPVPSPSRSTWNRPSPDQLSDASDHIDQPDSDDLKVS